MNEWIKEPWASDANKSSELSTSLDNIESDEGMVPTLQEAVEEAEYVLKTFSEGGHANFSMLIGEWAEDANQKKEQIARGKREVAAIKKFIKKYKTED